MRASGIISGLRSSVSTVGGVSMENTPPVSISILTGWPAIVIGTLTCPSEHGHGEFDNATDFTRIVGVRGGENCKRSRPHADQRAVRRYRCFS